MICALLIAFYITLAFFTVCAGSAAFEVHEGLGNRTYWSQIGYNSKVLAKAYGMTILIGTPLVLIVFGCIWLWENLGQCRGV